MVHQGSSGLFFCVMILMMPAPATCVAASDEELARLQDSFEQRRDAVFQLLAGQPLKVAKKNPPLQPDRGLYTRHYAYSIMNFAMKAFWLDESLDEANAAIVEYCRFYSGDRLARDDRDSFYWSTDTLCRLVEFFGSQGTRAKGRLRPATEPIVLELMWGYCHDNSRLADADFQHTKTWHVLASENHHAQFFSTLWQFSKFLAGAPRYRGRQYAAGGTPGEHYQAWTAYGKEYLRERVRKGLFIEMASKGYNEKTLKGIYNFYDFADDPQLRRLAGCVLDLYWATWAEEQIDGVRGGAAARIYQGPGSLSTFGDLIGRLAGFYLGKDMGTPPRENELTVLTSNYRMPPVVMDLALDTPGRGVYEIRQRAMGLAEKGYFDSPDYRLRTDTGGLVRYSYCTPDFILGTALLESRPLEDWTAISSQNRWHGVIFAGDPNARIVPECAGGGRGGNRTMNQQWSVQCKGTLIAQKLPGSKYARDMRVWFAGKGLTNRVERGGWVFVEAQGAYAAVRPARGGYVWEEGHGLLAAGQWMRCKDQWTPVILEVVRKADVQRYDAFQQAVLAAELRLEDHALSYRGLGGDTFTFYADHGKPPRVNGVPVDYAPRKVFDSPFIQSEWNSGLVTIQKGKRKLIIDVGQTFLSAP